MKKYTKNFFLFGKDKFFTSDSMMIKNDPNIIHNYLKNMTFQNSIIFLGSRTFKHFNDTYMFKVLNNFTKDNNFNHTNFLSNKEPNYKIKYREYKLNEDLIWHFMRRRINSDISFPDLNSTKIFKEKDSICKQMSLKDCKKKHESNSSIPEKVHADNNIDIWHLVYLS